MRPEENQETDLTLDEQNALKGARADYAPPPNLEVRIRKELRRRGLLVGPPVWRNWRLVAALAAVMLAFAFGTQWRSLFQSAKPQPRFMLLLYEDASTWKGASEGQAKLAKEYRAWAQMLERTGALVTADELDKSAAVLTTTGLQGTSAILEQNGQPDGFFLISARNQSEALEIARTCPHLRYGGSVVVQKVVM